MRLNLGRLVFGASVIALGIITLVWHSYGPIYTYLVAAAEILGGIAIQFRRIAICGAVALMAVYALFAAMRVPAILATPRVFDTWDNFFEMVSLFTGAALIAAHLSSNVPRERTLAAGRILYGLCTIAFMLEQALYLHETAAFVPKWFPPSPMFWAIATTIFFALGAIALVINRFASLAAVLLTAMIVGFGLIVWVPLVAGNPHSHGNWSECALTFAIAGTAWILSDLLRSDSL